MKKNHKFILLVFVTSIYFCDTAHGFQSHDRDNVFANLINIEEHDVDLDSNTILLPVKMFGNFYKFVLDTGSNVMVYDTKFEPKLTAVDQHADVSTPNNTTTSYRLYQSPLAHLGTYSIQTKEHVICADFSAIRSEINDDIYGIIGMPFIKEHGIFIDSDNSKFYIFDLAKNSHVNSHAFSFSMPISIFKLKPTITAELPSLGMRQFKIDTGSDSGITVDHSDFETLLNTKEIQLGESANFKTISRIGSERRGNLTRIRFDHFDSSRIKISENNKSQLIGLDTLKRFNFMLDFPNKIAYFNTRRDLSYLKAFSTLGFEIIHRNGQFVVMSVDEGGRAFKSDIKSGDVIVRIENKNVVDLDINTICKMLLEFEDINLLLVRGSKYYTKIIR